MIRAASLGDLEDILAINLEWEHVLSPLDLVGLESLHQRSAYHRVFEDEGKVKAFLLALREGVDYDSLNYQWHAARTDRFLYVDRIAVASRAPRRGMGAALYQDLFAFAQATGIDTITCEFNLVPRNEASEKFHRRFGFEQVGTQWREQGKKQVSLEILRLAPSPDAASPERASS